MNTLTRYKEIESFLFSQLPMFQRVGPKAFKKDLKNIQFLMQYLGHPERDFKSIHIAGTNGKGSTAFFISQFLSALGYKVGLYTSPHYRDYRERIRYNKTLIPKTFVKTFVNKLIEDNILESELKPSFFEITVAMAFLYFKQVQPDYAIIETGLGGRLDSTNVIVPEVSTITNIGFDHMNFLGDTLALIAGEKAGIIKENVPVVIGKTQAETRPVFEKRAQELNCPVIFADVLPRVKLLDRLAAQFPAYQHENLYTAYYTVKTLHKNFKLTISIIDDFKIGLSDWGFIGRYTRREGPPQVICDSAHNKEGIESLMQSVEKEEYDKLHIVLAVVNDKAMDDIWPLYPQDATYYFSQARIPRAMNKDKLAREARKAGLRGKVYSGIPWALAAAKARAKENDLILVTGSIFTVAEVI